MNPDTRGVEAEWWSYETEADRAEERRIGEIVGAAWSLKPQKMSKWHTLDFAMLAGSTILAIVEAKRRHCTRDKYPTIMLSVRKFDAAIEYSTALLIPVFFAVQWDDVLGVAPLEVSKIHDVRWGGSDRGLPYDKEPLVFISTHHFVEPIELLPYVIGGSWNNER